MFLVRSARAAKRCTKKAIHSRTPGAILDGQRHQMFDNCAWTFRPIRRTDRAPDDRRPEETTATLTLGKGALRGMKFGLFGSAEVARGDNDGRVGQGFFDFLDQILLMMIKHLVIDTTPEV